MLHGNRAIKIGKIAVASGYALSGWNKQAPNKIATTTAVSPVLPPSLILLHFQYME